MVLSTLTAPRTISSPLTTSSTMVPRTLTSIRTSSSDIPTLARPIQSTVISPSLVSSQVSRILSSPAPSIPVIAPARVPVSQPPSIPVIEPARVPVSRPPSIPVIEPARVPIAARPVLTSAKAVATVIPKTDLFEVKPKVPVLSQRLPVPVRIPTRQAEVQATPSAGEKRVIGQDIAPSVIAATVPAESSQKEISQHKPSIPITSTLASKVAKNPFDASRGDFGPVPPPQWYIDHYMHEYDAISKNVQVSGLGAEESSSNNWGYFLAAGLLVSAAWFWQKSR